MGRLVLLFICCLVAAAAPGVRPAAAQILAPDEADPLLAALDIPDDAAVRGMWSATFPWPLVGLHTALMPTGTVLSYGSPAGEAVQDGRTFDIWDPTKGTGPSAHYTFENAQSIDSFCSAGTFLLSGSMLISGGSSRLSGGSSRASTLLDPRAKTASAVTAQLAFPRWYGSMITLADGRVLMVGGGRPYAVNAYQQVRSSLADGDASMVPEVYSAETGWRALTNAVSRDAFGPDLNRWWYPRAWVAPSGLVFGVSSDMMWSLDPAGAGEIRTLGTFKKGFSPITRPNIGPTSTAVMFDTGRILQVGGNGPDNLLQIAASAAATVIDINGAAPVLHEQRPMRFPRHWANSIVLPNGQVLVTGGSRHGDRAGRDAVYEAEIWDPGTKSWTTGAPAAHYRGYHSSTILLPNGAVLSTGGGLPGPVTNLNAEIYYPPYLFVAAGTRSELAPRPRIARINSSRLAYGDGLMLDLAEDEAVAKVVAIGISSSTHSSNSGQRLVGLPFVQSARSVSALMPASGNLAPPGHYLVHVVNTKGVPSRGLIVSLGPRDEIR